MQRGKLEVASRARPEFAQGLHVKVTNFPEKQLVVIHDIDLKKNFLIFIEKIENVTIDKKSDEFREYLNQSRFKVTSGLFNTYDNLIKKNYKIDVNYKTLDTIKNYFD